MGVGVAKGFTWKGMRSAHATELAASGASLPKRLEPVEWRSAAFLNCIDANKSDASEDLRMTRQQEINV